MAHGILNSLTQDTFVTFPSNSCRELTKVLLADQCAFPEGQRSAYILAETTPFHPIDYSWPDQPGDQGTAEIAGQVVQVADSITAAIDRRDGSLFLGRTIPVRRGDPDWMFVVAHIVDQAEDLAGWPGQAVTLQVDPLRRRHLSASHSSCHVMALALNHVIDAHKLWNKEAQLDSLGHPDFDQLAMAESEITTEASIDRYRIGKSLRKKGLDCARLVTELAEIIEDANELLRQWLKVPSPIVIEAREGTLSEVRAWTCSIDGRTARMPCGGTHLSDLQELVSLAVTAEVSATEPEIIVRTTPALAS